MLMINLFKKVLYHMEIPICMKITAFVKLYQTFWRPLVRLCFSIFMGIHFEVPAHALTPASNIEDTNHAGTDWTITAATSIAGGTTSGGSQSTGITVTVAKHSDRNSMGGSAWDSGNICEHYTNTRDPHRHRQRTRALKYLSDGYGQARIQRANAPECGGCSSSSGGASNRQQRTCRLKPAQVVLMAVSAEQTMGRPDC